MTTASTTPGQSPAITEIERLGFGYTVEPQFDLTTLDTSRRVQSRESGHYAPKDEVERYAVQMEHSQFPPIVVTSDNWIVDGNTRVGASIARKNNFFPATVLDVVYGRGSEKQRNQLLVLAATLNQQNGRPLTRKEMREDAKAAVELGWKTEQIGRALGIKASVVTQVRKELEAVAKLERVGLHENGGKEAVSAASLRALGSKNVVDLNDVPFKELAELTRDAALNAGEVTGFAREMRETGSDEGALGKIRALRVEMGDRVREHELTGSRTKPPASRRLRQYLGNVVKYEGREQELIETDPKVTAQHAEMVERSIKVLSVLLETQR